MTVSEQITRIKNAKAAIKQAIQNKGVTVSDDAKLDEYSTLIDSITGGSGGSGGSGDGELGYFYNIRTSNSTTYKGLFAYTNIVNLDISSYNFDSSNVTDMGYMFANSGSQLGTITGLHSLDYSKVKYINHMFYYSYTGGDIDFSGISFPEVISVNYMFSGTSEIKSIDMSNTSFPKLTTASYMFSTSISSKTTSINLTGINMPNITSADSMFEYNSKVTELDLSGINFSKVTSISSIFAQCKLLATVMGEIDLSSVSSGLYSSAYSNPFRLCYALETIWLKNIYKDCTKMKNEAKWSINLADTKVKDECLVYIINELPDLINDKGLTATDKIVFTLPTTNTLTDEQKQVAINKGWQVVN